MPAGLLLRCLRELFDTDGDDLCFTTEEMTWGIMFDIAADETPPLRICRWGSPTAG